MAGLSIEAGSPLLRSLRNTAPCQSGELPLGSVKALADIGIEFPERLRGATPAEISELIESRRAFKNDGRPLALIVLPKKDKNGAFAHNKVLELMRKGYHVVLIEAGKDTDLYSAIKGYGEKQKISLLWIGGHGTLDSVNFGHDDADLSKPYDESEYLDFSDRAEMRKLGLGRYMEKKSVVILQSCSTGKGREGKFNISNMLGEVFIHSTVWAPEVDTNIKALKYDGSNQVIGIDYWENAATYPSYPLSVAHPQRIINYIVNPASLGNINPQASADKFFSKTN